MSACAPTPMLSIMGNRKFLLIYREKCVTIWGKGLRTEVDMDLNSAVDDA